MLKKMTIGLALSVLASGAVMAKEHNHFPSVESNSKNCSFLVKEDGNPNFVPMKSISAIFISPNGRRLILKLFSGYSVSVDIPKGKSKDVHFNDMVSAYNKCIGEPTVLEF